MCLPHRAPPVLPASPASDSVRISSVPPAPVFLRHHHDGSHRRRIRRGRDAWEEGTRDRLGRDTHRVPSFTSHQGAAEGPQGDTQR